MLSYDFCVIVQMLRLLQLYVQDLTAEKKAFISFLSYHHCNKFTSVQRKPIASAWRSFNHWALLFIPNKAMLPMCGMTSQMSTISDLIQIGSLWVTDVLKASNYLDRSCCPLKCLASYTGDFNSHYMS